MTRALARFYWAGPALLTLVLSAYQITVQLTRQLPPRELPPDVADRLLAKLKECQPPE